MRHLGAFRRQGLVVIELRGFRIERQRELVAPAEFEPRLGHGIVPDARRGMALGEVGGMGGDAIGDHAGLHIVAVRQAQMLLGRDIAKHGAAEPADHRRADGRGDVVIARRHIGGQRPKRIKGRLVAGCQLAVHVFLDLVHRHMAGAFDHHLHIVPLRDLVEFAQRIQFGELGGVIGVGGRAGTQTVAQAERHIVLLQQFANLFKVRVEEIFLVMRQAPFGQDRATA